MDQQPPRFIPGDHLLPQVARLRGQLCISLLDQLDAQDALRKALLQLEFLPYALGATCFAVLELARTQSAAVAAIAAHEAPNSETALSEPERSQLCYQLDGFLDAARRTQNALIPYLRHATDRGATLPKSMPDLVKSLGAGRVVLPPALTSLIVDYWNSHGRTLKAYRDLAQHHAIVASEPRVRVSNEGTAGIYFSLPNNPATKSPSALSYEDPQIHVQVFVIEHFFRLLQFCHQIANALIDPNDNRFLIPMTGMRSMIRIGRGAPDCYVPPDAAAIATAIQKAVEAMRSSST
jgi:hypothetical protein